MKRICVDIEMPQKNKRRIEGHDGHAEFIQFLFHMYIFPES